MKKINTDGGQLDVHKSNIEGMTVSTKDVFTGWEEELLTLPIQLYKGPLCIFQMNDPGSRRLCNQQDLLDNIKEPGLRKRLLPVARDGLGMRMGLS